MNPWVPAVGEKFLAPEPDTGALTLHTCTKRTNRQNPVIWHHDRPFPHSAIVRPTFEMVYSMYMEALETTAQLGELADCLQREVPQKIAEPLWGEQTITGSAKNCGTGKKVDSNCHTPDRNWCTTSEQSSRNRVR